MTRYRRDDAARPSRACASTLPRSSVGPTRRRTQTRLHLGHGNPLTPYLQRVAAGLVLLPLLALFLAAAIPGVAAAVTVGPSTVEVGSVERGATISGSVSIRNGDTDPAELGFEVTDDPDEAVALSHASASVGGRTTFTLHYTLRIADDATIGTHRPSIRVTEADATTGDGTAQAAVRTQITYHVSGFDVTYTDVLDNGTLFIRLVNGHDLDVTSAPFVAVGSAGKTHLSHLLAERTTPPSHSRQAHAPLDLASLPDGEHVLRISGTAHLADGTSAPYAADYRLVVQNGTASLGEAAPGSPTSAEGSNDGSGGSGSSGSGTSGSGTSGSGSSGGGGGGGGSGGSGGSADPTDAAPAEERPTPRVIRENDTLIVHDAIPLNERGRPHGSFSVEMDGARHLRLPFTAATDPAPSDSARGSAAPRVDELLLEYSTPLASLHVQWRDTTEDPPASGTGASRSAPLAFDLHATAVDATGAHPSVTAARLRFAPSDAATDQGPEPSSERPVLVLVHEATPGRWVREPSFLLPTGSIEGFAAGFSPFALVPYSEAEALPAGAGFTIAAVAERLHDAAPPRVGAVVVQTTGATSCQAIVRVAADVRDDTGLDQVRLLDGERVLATAAQAPWVFEIPITELGAATEPGSGCLSDPEGLSLMLQVAAVDVGGHETRSPVVAHQTGPLGVPSGAAARSWSPAMTAWLLAVTVSSLLLGAVVGGTVHGRRHVRRHPASPRPQDRDRDRAGARPPHPVGDDGSPPGGA